MRIKIILKISILVIVLIIVSCGNSRDKIERIYKENPALIMSEDSSYILYSEKGVLKSKIKTTSWNIYKQINDKPAYKEALKGFEVYFYNEQGQIESYVKGMHGKTMNNDNLIEINYNVIMFNMKNNQTLYTEQLFWDRIKKEFYTEKRCKIVTKEGVLFGIGMTAKENLDGGYQLKRVSGEFEVEKKKND